MNYIEIIDKHKDEMIQFLQEMIRIESVGQPAMKAKDGQIYPFGKEVQRALEVFLKKAEEFGMATENIDNYGGHADYPKVDPAGLERSKPLMVGVLGHLDVVPTGETADTKWDFPPFCGDVKDGIIYGRGTQDDKGPMVAALFAIGALIESGFKPKKDIRLIVGLDEENTWDGMKYYKEHVEMPDVGFSPDADFPGTNGEKGVYTFEIAKKLKKSNAEGIELRTIDGGTAPNMVPGFARALVRANTKDAYDHIKQMAKNYEEETGKKIYCKGVGKSFEIVAKGIPAHGAMPEAGVNAIGILMGFLGKINFNNEEINNFIDFYNSHIGMEIYGKSLGCKMEDEESGPLTLNVGILKMDKEAIKIIINVRYPVTKTLEEVRDIVISKIDKYDMGLMHIFDMRPIYFSPEENFVKTLVETYRDYSGDTTSKPYVMSGGSFARSMDNCICFGGLYPEDEDMMHQRNECVKVQRIVDMAKIYAEAIYRLSKDEEI